MYYFQENQRDQENQTTSVKTSLNHRYGGGYGVLVNEMLQVQIMQRAPY